VASESGGSRVPELASLSADEYDVSLKNVNGVPEARCRSPRDVNRA
jgi:hypothetical protein